MEKQTNYKAAFQMLGKCVICYDNGSVCSDINDTQKIRYSIKENVFTPKIEQGRVEECLIFKSTKKWKKKIFKKW